MGELQQPSDPVLLGVLLHVDGDHVHCGLRGHLPKDYLWKNVHHHIHTHWIRKSLIELFYALGIIDNLNC